MANSRLKYFRERSGLSQSQLAELVGLTTDVYRKFESGARPIDNARLSTGMRICRTLKCQPEEIMEEYAEFFQTSSDADIKAE